MGACFHYKHIKFAFFLTQKYSCLNDKTLLQRRCNIRIQSQNISCPLGNLVIFLLSSTHLSKTFALLTNQQEPTHLEIRVLVSDPSACPSFLSVTAMKILCSCHASGWHKWCLEGICSTYEIVIFFGDRWHTCSQLNNKDLLRQAIHIHFIVPLR